MSFLSDTQNMSLPQWFTWAAAWKQIIYIQSYLLSLHTLKSKTLISPWSVSSSWNPAVTVHENNPFFHIIHYRLSISPTMSSVQLLLFISPAVTHYSQLCVWARQELNDEFIRWMMDCNCSARNLTELISSVEAFMLNGFFSPPLPGPCKSSSACFLFFKAVKLLISDLNALL